MFCSPGLLLNSAAMFRISFLAPPPPPSCFYGGSISIEHEVMGLIAPTKRVESVLTKEDDL